MKQSDNIKQSERPEFVGDIPTKPDPILGIDHMRREVSIPMRDGVKLHTVLIMPKGAENAPIVLERTPYNASKLSRQSGSQRASMLMYAFHAELVEAGYIVAIQDVRGKYKSEGDYILNRPVRGALNPDDIDHVTDAWDTIDWLSQNVPESNAKIATLGISYDGFTTLMSLLDPHPALKAAVPINPMTDCWTGDDWFHNGAFRQTEASRYVFLQTMSKNSDVLWPLGRQDEYDIWLEAGSAGELARQIGMDDLPAWKRMVRHPAFDEYWQGQALDHLLKQSPGSVPVLNVYSRFDAEDTYGAMAAFLAIEESRKKSTPNHLVIGPWTHPGVGFDRGDQIGVLKLGSNTAHWFRQTIMIPFLDRHLLEGDESDLGPVSAFETGSNEWHTYKNWPPQSDDEFSAVTRSLFLQEEFGLSFSAPETTAKCDEFVSDPSKPVTYVPRPNTSRGMPGTVWDHWLMSDQRFAGDRPDVLRYTSQPLETDLHLAGAPVAKFWASISGTDIDWVVKLIDVYPDEYADCPELASYQMPISMQILRARYRDDPAHPTPVPSNEIVEYRIELPHASHMIKAGHRLMVQVQCSWFPLYDRNPQTFVDNIMFAEPGDFRPSTNRVFRDALRPSQVILPILDRNTGV